MVDARLPADARMPRGARVNVVLPPLSLTGPTVTIRLFPKAYGLAELLAARHPRPGRPPSCCPPASAGG